MLDGKNVKLISLSWDEGRLFDFWSIVHFLGGMLIAFSSHLLGFGYIFSYVGTFVGMVIYETIEEYFGIQETIDNRILDVVYGMAGFALVYELVLPNIGQDRKIIWFAVLIVLVAVGLSLGWRAYMKRE